MILVRYAELALKGGNRNYFEKRLVRNLKDCLKKNKVSFEKIERLPGRILIHTDNSCKQLKNVFGVHSYSNCVVAKLDIVEIKKAALPLIKSLDNKKTFRVSAHRCDKSIKLKSAQINQELGQFIVEKTCAKVSLKDFDFELGVELISGNAYIFNERVKCLGGLPLGVEGRVIALIENKKDQLAALLMMKRGCAVIPVGLRKVDISLLKVYSYGTKLELELVKDLKELGVLAKKYCVELFVTGQTLKDFKELGLDMVHLMPLIAFDENEIKQKLEELK